MEKKPKGIFVYGFLFVFIGLLVSLGAAHGHLMMNADKETLEEHYGKQAEAPLATTDLPEKLRPEYMAEKHYEMNKRLKEMRFFMPVSLTSSCIYLSMLIIGIGILRSKYWACRLVPIISGIAIIQIPIGTIYSHRVLTISKTYLGDIPFVGNLMTISQVLSILFSLLYLTFFISAIYYFTRPKVKEQFK